MGQSSLGVILAQEDIATWENRDTCQLSQDWATGEMCLFQRVGGGLVLQSEHVLLQQVIVEGTFKRIVSYTTQR